MRPTDSQPNIDFSSAHPTWSSKFWLLVIVSGVAAGLAGGLLMRMLKWVEHTAWYYRQGDLLQAASRASAAHRILMLAAAGLVVGVGGVLIRRLVGKPSEVNAAIWFRSGRIPLLATMAQAVHSIVIVGMGTSLGRESPIKQAGGALASRIASWAGLSRPEQRLLVACGVGAGMAAAYNVPVGGALFAIEVLIGSITMRMALPALLCSGVATVSSWLLLPTGPIYQVPEFPLSAQLTAWSILAGPLLGLAAVPMIRAIGWADAHKPQRMAHALVAPLVGLTLLGVLAIWFPQLLGNGKDTVQLAFANQLGIGLLLVLPALKLLATSGCLGCGASGGLFTPTMTIGALLGGLLGHLWDRVCPGASMGSCAVIGSCAFLAAATHGPISSLVLVLELTRHIDTTMAPMLMAVVGAVFVVRRIERRSVYSVRLHLDKATDAAERARQSASCPQLRSGGYAVVPAAMAYTDIADLIMGPAPEPKQPTYVVDDKGRLVGRIDSAGFAKVHTLPVALEAAKAADLCSPADCLTTAMDAGQLDAALRASPEPALPMVEAESGRLLGIVCATAKH